MTLDERDLLLMLADFVTSDLRNREMPAYAGAIDDLAGKITTQPPAAPEKFADPKCEMCDGRGEVGGFVGTPGSGCEGFETNRCPDCHGTGRQRSEGKAESDAPMFDYLSSHDGPVVEGLEQFETVYAKNQPQYLPLRTLPGEDGNSAISRFHLTDAQRKTIAEGADIYLEILHFRGPLAPSRLMVMSEPETGEMHFHAWWKAQTRGTYPVAIEEAFSPAAGGRTPGQRNVPMEQGELGVGIKSDTQR